MLIFLTPLFGKIDPSGLVGNYGPGGGGLAKFIANMINTIYIIAGLAFFIYLSIGGLKYLTASGDPKQVQEATKQLTNAIVGLIIVVASYGIVSVLGNILGINIFAPVFVGP